MAGFAAAARQALIDPLRCPTGLGPSARVPGTGPKAVRQSRQGRFHPLEPALANHCPTSRASAEEQARQTPASPACALLAVPAQAAGFLRQTCPLGLFAQLL